jgi:hypothetical protein
MIERLFKWLEAGAYNAILRGCRRAVTDLTGGEVDVEDPPKLEAPKKQRGRPRKS